MAAPVSLSHALLVLALYASPAADEDWKYDFVYLKSGGCLKGLVVLETRDEVVVWRVSRKPGAYTGVIVTRVGRDELDHIDRIDDAERQRLTARLKALDPTGKGELRRMAGLTLATGDWGKNGKGQALVYESEHFRLESNAAEDVVRRGAVRLENLYAAYARYLPPRQAAARPTRIVLARSLADYQELLRDSGQAGLVNPAFYDPARNVIVCGSDLQRLGDELERVRRQHQQLLAELKERETELTRLYKGRVPAALADPIRDARQRVAAGDDRNEKAFQEATARLFRRLYHEAFHAYLANSVYPPDQADVPPWLNEGLAQVFESALVEAGELRVGAPDKERLAKARELLAKGHFPALSELLRAGPKQFLVAHGSDRLTSDRSYLASWALAHYLTFERRLLGTKAMDEYVRALHRGADPLEAFAALVGHGLSAFERDWVRYLEHLPAASK